jgi:hypothetical protein
MRSKGLRGAGLAAGFALTIGGLVGGVARADATVVNGTVTAFDSTKIAYTLFVPAGANSV